MRDDGSTDATDEQRPEGAEERTSTTVTISTELRDRLGRARDRIAERGAAAVPVSLRPRWRELQRTRGGDRLRNAFGLSIVVELAMDLLDTEMDRPVLEVVTPYEGPVDISIGTSGTPPDAATHATVGGMSVSDWLPPAEPAGVRARDEQTVVTRPDGATLTTGLGVTLTPDEADAEVDRLASEMRAAPEKPRPLRPGRNARSQKPRGRKR